MFGSDLLGIAVGLILLYLLLSVLASAANEIVESLLKYRARYLERGLREMLGDSSGTGLVRSLYDHPLISGLFRGTYSPKRRGNLPSYIPAHTFALALMDLARGEPVETVPMAAVVAPVAGLGLLDVPLSSRTPATSAPILPLETAPSHAPASPPDPLATLRNTILSSKELGDQPRKALIALLDSAGGNLDLAMHRLENWYDATMNRVSGSYKRRTQWMLLIVGLIIATIFNADTIAVFKSLANDPPERAMLLDVAREYAKTPLPSAAASAVVTPPESPAPASGEGTSPVSGGSSVTHVTRSALPGSAAQATGDPCPYPTGSAECRISEDIRQVRSLRLPLGWQMSDPRLYPGASIVNWMWKAIGILITAVAITLGAPFWFDMLNQVMVARATLKPVDRKV